MKEPPFKLKRLWKRQDEIFLKLPAVTSDEMERVLRVELAAIEKQISTFNVREFFLPTFPIQTGLKKDKPKPEGKSEPEPI